MHKKREKKKEKHTLFQMNYIFICPENSVTTEHMCKSALWVPSKNHISHLLWKCTKLAPPQQTHTQ